MLERSSARDVVAVLVALALGACGNKDKAEPKKPEADPARVKELAVVMARNVPTPGGVPDCTPDDLRGATTLTFRSLLLLAGQKLSEKPEHGAWVNPPELDAPAVRTLVDPPAKAPKNAARVAAAELLGAKAWVAYKVDLVNAPMALGVKELKIGTIHTRVFRYGMDGVATCVMIFNFQNDKAVSDLAIEKSDKGEIEPAVAKLLREDLTAQYIKLAPR